MSSPTQPAACSIDGDCATINARCFPGLSTESVSPQQIPFNNSLYCYCDLWYNWAGPSCSQLSPESIAVGVSNLAIGFIALVLAITLVVDVVVLRRYTARDAQRRSKSQPSVPPGASRAALNPSTGSVNVGCCNGSDSKRRMDMHMVTSIILFLALLTLLGWMIVDTIRNWMLQTCIDKNGERHNCNLVWNSIFLCGVPILGMPLMLLLSVLMYNASFKANGLSSLPFASFWTLMALDTALFATLIATAVTFDYRIASFSGAIFAILLWIINVMTCYRLRDFSFIKLILRCSCGRLNGCVKPVPGQTERRRWTIKQRLMAISVSMCFLYLLMIVCLILRGAYDNVNTAPAIQGRIAVVSENIFRWTYLGVLTVYFTLIHYNSKQRVRIIAQRLATPQQMLQRTILDAPPDIERSQPSSQPSIHQVQPDHVDQRRLMESQAANSLTSSSSPTTTSKDGPTGQIQRV